jgi:hypothetical protein
MRSEASQRQVESVQRDIERLQQKQSDSFKEEAPPF